MNKLRNVALLTIVCTLFVLAIGLHQHRKGSDPTTLDCKLCEVSKASVIQSVETPSAPQMVDFGTLCFETSFYEPVHYHSNTLNRAPPLS